MPVHNSAPDSKSGAALPALTYLCLLRHRTSPHFCVGPLLPQGEEDSTLPEGTDPSSGFALGFSTDEEADKAAKVLQSLARCKTEPLVRDGTVWFPVSTLAALTELASHALKGWLQLKEIRPSTDIFGATVTEPTRSAALPGTSDPVVPGHSSSGHTSGAALLPPLDHIWVSAEANREACARALGQLFSRIAELAGGTAVRRRTSASDTLGFTVPIFHNDEVLDVLEELAEVRVFDATPLASFEHGKLVFQTTAANKSREGDRYVLSIATPYDHFAELLDSLTPGIRGWDRPLYQERAAPDTEKARRSTERESSPPNASTLWKIGGKVRGIAPTDYFKSFGINLGWAPSTLRFVAQSPLRRDDGAPLLLLRLDDRQGNAVGFQRIRLDTHGRKLVAFDGGALPPVIGNLGKLKGQCALTTVLEDAVAVQRLTLEAATVMPLPTSFEAVPLDQGVTEFTIYLPANVPEWIEPAFAFSKAAQASGAVVRIFQPSQLALESVIGKPDAPVFWWKVLKGRNALEPELASALPGR